MIHIQTRNLFIGTTKVNPASQIFTETYTLFSEQNKKLADANELLRIVSQY